MNINNMNYGKNCCNRKFQYRSGYPYAAYSSPGETLIGSDFMINAGGKGANQAVAAARMGGDVCFVACVGDDGFGAEAVRHYAGEGIDTSISYAAMALLRAWRLSP